MREGGVCIVRAGLNQSSPSFKRDYLLKFLVLMVDLAAPSPCLSVISQVYMNPLNIKY